jgi:hypothetical protein
VERSNPQGGKRENVTTGAPERLGRELSRGGPEVSFDSMSEMTLRLLLYCGMCTNHDGDGVDRY